MSLDTSDLKAGTEGPVFVDEPLTVTDFVRYQGASGDMNPMHHDTEAAKATGYPQPFAVGMRQAGVMATYATDWLGAENIRHFKVRFLEIAWPKDVISYSGKVVELREVDGEPLVDIEMAATRADGAVLLKGWASFVTS